VALQFASESCSSIRSIAREVAARYASEVDAQARFPSETFAALRAGKLLTAALPTQLGGGGACMRELAEMCMLLSQGCAASGMILAMHHIQVACIARHGMSSPFFRRYAEELVARQLLIASVTSEVGVWGDTRQSLCALVREGDRFKLDKDATTISYGEAADDLLVTCRRGPDAPGSDQILVLLRGGQYRLERTGSWDTLGLRGTCSPGYKVTSSGALEQIVPAPFADISAHTMVSYSHILWSAVWLGIAADAFARASAFVRAEARKTPGQVPARATRLAELAVQLQTMRNDVHAQAAEFDAISSRPKAAADALSSVGWALRMNNLKVACSEAAPRIVHQALQIVGLSGYKNDSRFSVGRHYRDALSGALMISNDRIFSKNASMLLVYKDE